ncbi:hypothetical protein ALC60_01282 [Trachymyrmex zeteki]|uniref:Uncharacterized protein n=1 Tax=Mycetomoellerius zeteki TaxID=64791 RepID=A0A151XGU3_9HYME|nr:hypothetical protein ALC60_01282 [Trachymyrmex zeteki]
MSSNMDDVPIEISAEDHFSHETLSLVVCVSEIIGQTRKKATERDLKSGKLCRNSLCGFRVVRNIRHSARFLRLAKSQDEKAAERIPVHTHTHTPHN